MLNIAMENTDGVLHVALEGRLNNATSKDLSRQLEPELDNARCVVFDLANLEYISSAGLRIIVAVQQHMENIDGEDVCVRNATGIVLETLEMTGFRSLVNIE